MDQFDIYTFLVSKEEIASCDTGRLLTGIAQVAEQNGGVAYIRGRIGLQVDGYNDEPCGLWHVPAVKKYFEAIDEMIPWFVFFLVNRESPMSLFLYVSFFKNIEYTGDSSIHEEEKAQRLFADLMDFLGDRGGALDDVCRQSTNDGFPVHFTHLFADVIECFGLAIDREKFYASF